MTSALGKRKAVEPLPATPGTTRSCANDDADSSSGGSSASTGGPAVRKSCRSVHPIAELLAAATPLVPTLCRIVVDEYYRPAWDWEYLSNQLVAATTFDHVKTAAQACFAAARTMHEQKLGGPESGDVEPEDLGRHWEPLYARMSEPGRSALHKCLADALSTPQGQGWVKRAWLEDEGKSASVPVFLAKWLYIGGLRCTENAWRLCCEAIGGWISAGPAPEDRVVLVELLTWLTWPFAYRPIKQRGSACQEEHIGRWIWHQIGAISFNRENVYGLMESLAVNYKREGKWFIPWDDIACKLADRPYLEWK